VFTEPTDLSPTQVRDVVAERWAVPVEGCRYLPAGMGAHHWLGYPAGSDEPAWIAHGDMTEAVRAPYRAAAALAAAGLAFVAPPLPPTDGDVLAHAGAAWWLSLVAFVPSTSGPGGYRDDAERARIARLIGALHAATPPASLPRWAPPASWPRIDALLLDLDRPWTAGPMGEQARDLLSRHAGQVRRLLAEFDARCAEELPGEQPWVVTHGEPHTGNVLDTGDGRLLLIDWDTAALAPRERDLRELVAGATGPGPWRAYRDAGGSPVELSPGIADVFDRLWVLSEIDAYGTQLYEPHTGGTDDRIGIDALRDYLGD